MVWINATKQEELVSEKAIYATIQNGRYVIDEIAEGIPEGKRLRLVIDDEFNGDSEAPTLNDEERSRLNATLDQSIAEHAAGKRHTWDEVKSLAQARHK